jgi:hypothetical protein
VVTRPDDPLPPEQPPQDDPSRDPDTRDDTEGPFEIDTDELRVDPEDSS